MTEPDVDSETEFYEEEIARIQDKLNNIYDNIGSVVLKSEPDDDGYRIVGEGMVCVGEDQNGERDFRDLEFSVTKTHTSLKDAFEEAESVLQDEIESFRRLRDKSAGVPNEPDCEPPENE